MAIGFLAKEQQRKRCSKKSYKEAMLMCGVYVFVFMCVCVQNAVDTKTMTEFSVHLSLCSPFSLLYSRRGSQES